MAEKRFALSASEILPLAVGRGGCYASDMITVDGHKVGFMYREAPSFNGDSGWIFLSGNESQAYADDPGNWGIHDINTVANYDPEIISLLDAPPGSAFERPAGDGALVSAVPPGVPGRGV